MISESNGFYKLEFTTFIESDIALILNALRPKAINIADKIFSSKYFLYNDIERLKHYRSHHKDRWLYHIICDAIFDGSAFDYFESKEIFKTSKAQYDNRNYITYGFQDSNYMNELSNNLLCSSNNFRVGNYIFNSFGDSNGNRLDFFRLNRLLKSSQLGPETYPEVCKIYEKLNNKDHDEICLLCADLLNVIIENGVLDTKHLKNEEMACIEYLNLLNYISVKGDIVECQVPVFTKEDESILSNISEQILNMICLDVKETFEGFLNSSSEISAIHHGISKDEIMVEIWHQLFGMMNERLVELGLVSKPIHIKGEGRYFRSFYIQG